MALIDQKAKLFPLLQTALELELSTIPPYLTALLSIERNANRVAATLIRSVMMEEMLHMVLVGNLISSLGGTVHLGEKNIPSYPLRLMFEGVAFKDRAFDINLAPFSRSSLDTFMQIELPTSMARQTGLATSPEMDIPGITIGAFYQKIIDMLELMCKEFPQTAVFCGDPARQISEQYYWGGGGQPVIIKCRDTAREALHVIIEQGEGAGNSIFDDDHHYFDQPDEVAHYFRFKEIASGCYYRPGDKPNDPPSGKPFDVDYTAVFPIKVNAKSSDYKPGSSLAALNDSFNRQYSLVLSQIEQAFNGTPYLLYDAITNGMHALASIAIEMMSTPISSDSKDPTCGAPSFEWIAPLSSS
jgi:hypothetical protein